MKLPGASSFVQYSRVNSYVVNRNYEAVQGNPWTFTADLPTIDNVDLTAMAYVLQIYGQDNKSIIAEQLLASGTSPVQFTIPSEVTRLIEEGEYEYAIVAASGSGVSTVNYSLVNGVVSVLKNHYIQNNAARELRITL